MLTSLESLLGSNSERTTEKKEGSERRSRIGIWKQNLTEDAFRPLSPTAGFCFPCCKVCRCQCIRTFIAFSFHLLSFFCSFGHSLVKLKLLDWWYPCTLLSFAPCCIFFFFFWHLFPTPKRGTLSSLFF